MIHPIPESPSPMLHLHSETPSISNHFLNNNNLHRHPQTPLVLPNDAPHVSRSTLRNQSTDCARAPLDDGAVTRHAQFAMGCRSAGGRSSSRASTPSPSTSCPFWATATGACLPRMHSRFDGPARASCASLRLAKHTGHFVPSTVLHGEVEDTASVDSLLICGFIARASRVKKGGGGL
jgi:hypothetical protein